MRERTRKKNEVGPEPQEQARAPGKRSLTEGLQRRSGARGEPVPASAQRAAAESGIGDVSTVRIHRDAGAAASARELGAKAYTVGQDIYFGAGRYAPGSSEGDRLLGHELAHTAQQSDVQATQTKLEVSEPGDAHEREADRAGEIFAGAARGQTPAELASLTAVSEPMISRDPLEEEVEQEQQELTQDEVERALGYNRGRDFSQEIWDQIATVVDSNVSELSGELVRAIAAWQAEKGLSTDGMVGDITLQWLSQEPGGEGLDEHISNQDVLYVGMNADSRATELRRLRRVAGRRNVTGVVGSRRQDQVGVDGQAQDLGTPEGVEAFAASLEGLDESRRQQVVQFLNSGGGGAKDELAQLARVLYEAETGQRIIKRVILSGHSGGWSFGGSEDGFVTFAQLSVLTQIFPIAVGQVEDLMLSACNTGQHSRLDQYHAIFPNLESIWAYVGYSPSHHTGSLGHIAEWERSSRGEMDADKMNEGREEIASGRGRRDQNVALWTRSGGGQEQYETASPEASYDFDTLRSMVDSNMSHYEAAYEDGNINLQELSTLYTQVQNLVGSHSWQLGGEAARYERILKHILYLRHWENIARHFMQQHGDTIREAYRAAGAEAPAFARVSRAEALQAIESYPGESGDQAHELLTELLRDLDPTQIPDRWITH